MRPNFILRGRISDNLVVLKKLMDVSLKKVPQNINQVPKKIVIEKITHFNKWYTNLIGIDAVKVHQQRVIVLQDQLLKAQNRRRELTTEHNEIKIRANGLQNQIQGINRKENYDKYCKLIKDEKEVLDRKRSVSAKIKECNLEERDLFVAYTNAVRDFQESQRVQIEYSKYLGLFFTLAGSLITFLYTLLLKKRFYSPEGQTNSNSKPVDTDRRKKENHELQNTKLLTNNQNLSKKTIQDHQKQSWTAKTSTTVISTLSGVGSIVPQFVKNRFYSHEDQTNSNSMPVDTDRRKKENHELQNTKLLTNNQNLSKETIQDPQKQSWTAKTSTTVISTLSVVGSIVPQFVKNRFYSHEDQTNSNSKPVDTDGREKEIHKLQNKKLLANNQNLSEETIQDPQKQSWTAKTSTTVISTVSIVGSIVPQFVKNRFSSHDDQTNSNSNPVNADPQKQSWITKTSYTVISSPSIVGSICPQFLKNRFYGPADSTNNQNLSEETIPDPQKQSWMTKTTVISSLSVVGSVALAILLL